MRIDYNSSEALAPVIEALLFASDEALSAQELRSLILGEDTPKTDVAAEEEEIAEAPIAESPSAEAIDLPEGQVVAPVEKKRKRKQPIELPTIHTAVEQLNTTYTESDRAFRIVEIAGGYQFATRPEYSAYVARLFKERSRRRLSGAALETLAIVAYKQPVSKLDIENVRGVNCDEVIKSLLEKNLVTITGRAEAVGRPLLYGTTVDFLRHFGLHSLFDLPRPREIDELMKEEAFRATTLEEAADEFVSPDMLDEGMSVDAVLAVAKELGRKEEEVISQEEEKTAQENAGATSEREIDGIELDLAEMAMSANAMIDHSPASQDEGADQNND